MLLVQQNRRHATFARLALRLADRQKPIFTPIMGLSILLAIIVYLVRLISVQPNVNIDSVQPGTEKQA